MKIYNLFILAIIVIAVSCKKENANADDLSELTSLNSESGMSYSESLSNWNSLKVANGNSYIYQTVMVSWIGSESITELKVENGVVTGRKFHAYQKNHSNGEKELTDSYYESGEAVGANEKGALALTIDEIYATCASSYLVADTINNTIYFETEENGFLTLCGFAHKGCYDDCYLGLRINGFDWID